LKAATPANIRRARSLLAPGTQAGQQERTFTLKSEHHRAIGDRQQRQNFGKHYEATRPNRYYHDEI
jgi:hypothetical protein